MITFLAQASALHLQTGDLALIGAGVAGGFGVLKSLAWFVELVTGSKKRRSYETEFPGAAAMPTSIALQNMGCQMQHSELKSILQETVQTVQTLAHNTERLREAVQISHTTAIEQRAIIREQLNGLLAEARR